MWILSPWHAFISTWLETSAQRFGRAAPRLHSKIPRFFPLPRKVRSMQVRGQRGRRDRLNLLRKRCRSVCRYNNCAPKSKPPTCRAGARCTQAGWTLPHVSKSWCSSVSSNHTGQTGHTGRPVKFSPLVVGLVKSLKNWVYCQARARGRGFGCQLPPAQRLIQPSPPGKRLSASTPVMASSTEYSRIGQ